MSLAEERIVIITPHDCRPRVTQHPSQPASATRTSGDERAVAEGIGTEFFRCPCTSQPLRSACLVSKSSWMLCIPGGVAPLGGDADEVHRRSAGACLPRRGSR